MYVPTTVRRMEKKKKKTAGWMVDKIGRLAVGQPGDMWGGGGLHDR